ncbi:MAG TPA: transglycosylase SLT domain-containing protein [Thermoanaerobaculia bacterium]|jgi:soluble lytic murein transglycosylase|nr:transglycosylase SLT domain-containing protein [Thermoanaerobaculia bacterium]
MPRRFHLGSAALSLAAGGLALLAGAWLAVHAPERVAPPVSAAIQPREPSGAGENGRSPWRAGEHPVLRAQLWTPRFRALEERAAWEELADLLADVEARAPVLYRANRLGYLHARALIGAGEDEEAAAHLEPFLEPGDPYRALALHHAADLAAATNDETTAATRRRELLLDHPGSLYWHETLAEHLEWLEKNGNPPARLAFIDAVEPRADDERTRRELAAARVAALLDAGDVETASAEGTRLLDQSTADDAAEQVALLLDRPDVVRRLPPPALRDLGDSMLHHRQWQRAVDLFQLARRGLPNAHGDLDFAMGRARFFAEDFAEAERLYRRAAANAANRGDQARDLYHAARAAQLRGHDADAERLLGQAIGVPGRFDGTAAAITSRIRLRVHHGQFGGAGADLALLRKTFPRQRVVAEGAIAVAMGQLAAGHATAATNTLGPMPPSLDPYDQAEVAYWRARAAESRDPSRALAGYLEVLRAKVPTHYAYLARHRLAKGPFAAAAKAAALARRQQARAKLQTGDAEAARKLQTDAVLLADASDADLDLLREIYLAIPKYRAVLLARPLPLPAFPLRDPTPDELLAAMGLYDETVQTTGESYPLQPFPSGLTRSVVYHRAGASRLSIQAAESLMEQVPDDYVPQLLPRELRELLFPRYFYDWIADDAETYGADPRLLLAIMREESRFNPRAKSSAAARGLLQLLITTARQVAEGLGLVEVAPEDLYDPRLVIQLGAKYLGDLQRQFGGDPYAAAAAYNAGPAQARLWRQLQPAAGHDYFLSTVSFAETRHYVRKVLNSYERYGEIYQGEPPTGGVRAEP